MLLTRVELVNTHENSNFKSQEKLNKHKYLCGKYSIITEHVSWQDF